jgi:hypothetical protein
MMMSVFQQDRARYELDHLNCIAAASTPENADPVVLAVDTRHSVLVGLDNQSVVIKPVEDGDDRLSYLALYDTCYTLADLQRMKRSASRRLRMPPSTPSSSIWTLSSRAHSVSRSSCVPCTTVMPVCGCASRCKTTSCSRKP